MRRGRALAFAVLCVACAVGAGTYVYHAMQRSRPTSVSQPPEADGGAVGDTSGTMLLFRSTALDNSYGKLVLAPLNHVRDRRVIASLSCERVDYAHGRGVCLAAARGVFTKYSAIVFDQEFRTLFTLALAGAPSRVRVSADGAYAGVTVFVSGHDYVADFSTVTSIIDLQRGEYVVPDFERLTVWKGTERFEAADRNFWGVTFRNQPDTFYATVGSGGQTYLVEGSVGAHSAKLLRDGVECPSLSPDNTRVAFKQRTTQGIGPVRWRLSVLDVPTLEDRPLSETRSVDDQAAWLDDARIMYALPNAESGSAEMTTWVIDADGAGSPRMLVPQSYSTVVWRP
ncbi:MAG TPA: hypothetical protein VMW17_11525 [Candidatus Binatia bacterium]|nr:hypothetical protein [Candidatus Binatia bacterium]